MKKLFAIILMACLMSGCGSMIRGKSGQPIKPGLPNIHNDMNLSCEEMQYEINKLNGDKIKNDKRRKVGIACNISNTITGIIILIPWFFIDVQLSDYNLANDAIDSRIKDLLKLGYEKQCYLIIPELPEPEKVKERESER